MLEAAFPTLFPILLLVVFGWLLRGWHLLPEGFFEGLNSLVFYVGLPALLFLRIASSAIEGGPALRILWVMLAATGAVMLTAYLVARPMKLGGPARGSFVQASLRGNLAYIGLPVIFFSVGPHQGLTSEGAEALAVLVLAPTVPIYNILCVLILSHGSERGGALSTTLKKVASNPLLIACVLGVVVSSSGAELPLAVVRTLKPLSDMALPLALLSIGASFTGQAASKSFVPSLTASLLKVCLAPAFGLFFAAWWGLPPAASKIALIFLACPAAVTSYIMAEQLGADRDIARGAVILSTLLSFIPLALIVAFMG